MSSYKAKVVEGHLTLHEPTDLPEGQVVELEPRWVNLEEEMGAAEYQRFKMSLDRSYSEANQGRGVSMEEALEGL